MGHARHARLVRRGLVGVRVVPARRSSEECARQAGARLRLVGAQGGAVGEVAHDGQGEDHGRRGVRRVLHGSDDHGQEEPRQAEPRRGRVRPRGVVDGDGRPREREGRHPLRPLRPPDGVPHPEVPPRRLPRQHQEPQGRVDEGGERHPLLRHAAARAGARRLRLRVSARHSGGPEVLPLVGDADRDQRGVRVGSASDRQRAGVLRRRGR